MSILSVSEVNQYIKRLFDADKILNSIFVRGELSNFKRHHSGHCYFTLKDTGGMLRAVMFRSRAQFLKFSPRDGMKVVAGGNIAVFERDGQYQLYVEQLIPDGVGELNLALEQLKEKLSAEGLFAAARKRPLPVFPRTVGIITSPTGAAIRDIITVAKRRHPGVSLVLYPVQVQGAEAPGQIVHAIEAMNRIGAADVIIVGRGGGSMEELWAFNDEGVVRAIAASGIPVVSAVGHETDYTLADFVADQRAATPSQAAELTVPDVRELARHVITLRSMLATSMHRLLDGRRKNIERLRESHGFNRPRDMLTRQHQTLDMLFNRLQEAQKKQLVESQHRFQVAAEKLAMLSPLAVLARGYSITRDKTGKILYRADETRPGENLEIILRHGSIEVNVNRIEEENHAKQAIERKSGA